jgi:hypothetical protein
MNLACSIDLEPKRLVLWYTVDNDTGFEAFVHHFVHDNVSSPSCFVYIDDTDRLWLFFGWVPNPPGVRTVHDGVPWAARVAKNETLSSSVAIDLPVLENGKMNAPEATAPHDICSLRNVRVVMTYQQKIRGLHIQPDAEGRQFHIWGRVPGILQTDLLLHRPIEGQRRTDPEFHRPVGRSWPEWEKTPIVYPKLPLKWD